MSYQVFARKYRPQTFAQVVGQDHITRTLENSIRLGRIAQAYLLVGPRGTGKTSTARIIAKALNASNGPCIDFDPEEEICREIAEGRSLDVLEIDGASSRNIEGIRELRENARYAPIKGRFKIYIIDEVHMLTTESFNALLKTLEEPPAHVKFIFATTEVHKVPPTILSRCQRFDFRRIPDATIANHLQHICTLEHVTIAPEALNLLARHAEGGLRDAEVALDQVISFYGTEVTVEGVSEMFGLTGSAPILAIAHAIIHGQTTEVVQQLRSLNEAGRDLIRLSQELLRIFRHLVILQNGGTEALADGLSETETKTLRTLSQSLSPADALQLLEDISGLESRLRYALSKDILFEIALIQMSQLKQRVSLDRLLQEIATSGHHLDRPAPSSIPAASSSTAPSAPPLASVPSIDIQTAWNQARDQFIAQNPLEKNTLLALKIQTFEGPQLRLLLPLHLKHKLTYLTTPRNLEALQTLLQKETQTPALNITFHVEQEASADPVVVPSSAPAPSAAVAGPETPRPMTEDEFLHDPKIQEAIKIFEAKIIHHKAGTPSKTP